MSETAAENQETKQSGDQLMSTIQVAKMLGVSADTVRWFKDRGEMPYIDISSEQSIRPRLRFRRADIDDFLRRRTNRKKQRRAKHRRPNRKKKGEV